MTKHQVVATPLVALGLALVIGGAGASSSGCAGDASGPAFDPCSYFSVSNDFRTLYWTRCGVEVPPGVLSIDFSCSTDGESHQGTITVTRNNGVITSYSADIDGKHCSGSVP